MREGSSGAFFRDFYSNSNFSKYIFVICSLFLNASEVYLLVKTLEFVEKGPENQRTILARLMSGVIRYAIAYVPLVMWPQIVQSFTGPWPSLLCDIFLVLEHVIGTTIVILIVVFTVLKPAFIFKFKSVWALKVLPCSVGIS